MVLRLQQLVAVFVLVFNNKVLIQWGLTVMREVYSKDIQLPTSYSSVNYAFCIMDQNNMVETTPTQTPIFVIATTYKTASSIRVACDIYDVQATNWLSIGY